jgi:hypothetical protein
MKPHHLLLGTASLIVALSALAPLGASAQPNTQLQCELWLRNKPPIEPEYICISSGSAADRPITLVFEAPVTPTSTENGGPVIEPDDGDGEGHHHHKPHWLHWMKELGQLPMDHPQSGDPHSGPHGAPKEDAMSVRWNGGRELPGMPDMMKGDDLP